ncbi:hypothetical protein RFI_29578, partial [Reticulomyxa filosa]
MSFSSVITGVKNVTLDETLIKASIVNEIFAYITEEINSKRNDSFYRIPGFAITREINNNKELIPYYSLYSTCEYILFIHILLLSHFRILCNENEISKHYDSKIIKNIVELLKNYSNNCPKIDKIYLSSQKYECSSKNINWLIKIFIEDILDMLYDINQINS